jgi:methionine synthase II (cobalamin-independent)
MPGQDMAEALRVVMGELGEPPGLPFLPELPNRGVGADMVGRSAGLLVDLFAEVQPSGWRIADRPGRDHGRAMSYLSSDLDLLEEHTQGYSGLLKVQVAGPWTLTAAIELSYGDKMLADAGAVRDLTASLAEGLRNHLRALRRCVPGARFVLQLDEPSLPGALAGTVPTASGFGSLRAVEPAVAREQLRTVIEAVDVPVVVHCCAPDVPIELIRGAGADGVSLDFALLSENFDDTLAEAIEAETMLFAGVVPALDPAEPRTVSVKALVDRVLTLRRLGFPPARIARTVAVTPSCGLAGASPAWSRRALKLVSDAARALEEVE